MQGSCSCGILIGVGRWQNTLLLVEDQPDSLRIITYFLENAGYRVVQAHNGEDALKKLERYAVDLVVTDLEMPRMSGVHLIAHLKQDPATFDLPVIVVTAYGADPIGRSAADYGADAILPKPLDRLLLVKTVHEKLAARGARVPPSP
jgi:CheY-like chemotaxis protein